MATQASAAGTSGVSGARSAPSLMSSTDSWRLLKAHATEDEMPHLKELLADPKRCEKMFADHDGIMLDYSRQALTPAAAWRGSLDWAPSCTRPR